uniref:Sulfotransferase n=1 Tax=Haplochromis burtoni TaxID=8153 RepID=A0A3Q2WRQ3_HAPBU
SELIQSTIRFVLNQKFFPMINIFTDDWDNIQNFKARPDDILIATYPKAGTTWVSYILDLLYFSDMGPDRQTTIPIHERVPFLEFCVPPIPSGTDLAEQLPTTPRLIKTHLPVQFVPKSFWEQDCRIIYVARNAKDNAVSYFHFDRMNSLQPEPGDWSTFLQGFMEGNSESRAFGSWYDHVNGWWEKKQTYSNLLYMFYEDLIEVLWLVLMSLPLSAELFKTVLIVTLTNKDPQEHLIFIRKVGDWKNHFTVLQNEQFDEDYEHKMKNPALKFRFEI